MRRPRRRRRALRCVGRVLAGRAPATTCSSSRRSDYPREKTCGDGLTPRSVRQLEDMGLADELTPYHRYEGLRAIAFGRTIEMSWPEAGDLPTHGYVITRADLDGLVAARAEKAGAVVWQGAEAVAPLSAPSKPPEPPGVSGARRATLSRFLRLAVAPGRWCHRERPAPWDDHRGPGPLRGRGRRAPTPGSAGRSAPARNRDWPQGMALRGYYRSPRHDEPWIDRCLDIRDADGQGGARLRLDLPARRRARERRRRPAVHLRPWKDVNTTQLMEPSSPTPRRRGASAPRPRCGPPTGGRLPMGLVGRPARRARLRSSPATPAGSINPFNGEGIAYAYETGRLAAGRGPRGPRQRRRAWPLRDYERRSRTPTACTSGGPGLRARSSAGPS